MSQLVNDLTRFARAYTRSDAPPPAPPSTPKPRAKGGRKPGVRVKGWCECGVKGVWKTRYGKYQAAVRTRGVRVNLGNYPTLAEAAEAVARHMAKLED